jgi:hypothetical protein
LTVFHVFGRFLSTVFSILFLQKPVDSFARLSASDLEPIAMVMQDDDFELHQLVSRSYEIMLRLQQQKPKEWEIYRKELSRLAGNSVQYLGDFITLLLLWIMLFGASRSESWINLNIAHFWPVFLILLALIWFASMRASNALKALPVLQIKFVSGMMQLHPDLMPFEDPVEKHKKRFLHLQNLLTAQRTKEDQDTYSRPSFRRVLGLIERPESSCAYPVLDRSKLSFYMRGKELSFQGSPKDLSLSDVLAYKFYCAYKALERTYRSLLMFVRYLITGVPPL